MVDTPGRSVACHPYRKKRCCRPAIAPSAHGLENHGIVFHLTVTVTIVGVATLKIALTCFEIQKRHITFTLVSNTPRAHPMARLLRTIQFPLRSNSDKVHYSFTLVQPDSITFNILKCRIRLKPCVPSQDAQNTLCLPGLSGGDLSFCGFRGKHRPAISIAGLIFCARHKK